MAVLLAKYLRYDFDAPGTRANDRLIFSKGHASTLLYAMFRRAGAISDEELLTYRQFGSMLEGHPTPLIPWVDVATGSLGQGLPIGVGMAIAGKRLDRLPYRVWVLCGDSEIAEGSIWEAFEHAAHYELDNLTAIIDVNRLGQRGQTMDEWDLDHYRARARRSAGTRSRSTATTSRRSTRPTPRRRRRRDSRPWSSRGRSRARASRRSRTRRAGTASRSTTRTPRSRSSAALRNIDVDVAKPERAASRTCFETGALELPRYELGSEVATRKAYGDALAALGSRARRRRRGRRRGLELDLRRDLQGRAPGPVLRDVHRRAADGRRGGRAPGARLPRRSRRRLPPSTRAPTTSSGWRRSRARRCASAGSHAGISIGEDGPSQMALEDLASIRAVHGSTVLHPATGTRPRSWSRRWPTSTGSRTSARSRPNTPVIYGPDEEFPVGGSRGRALVATATT